MPNKKSIYAAAVRTCRNKGWKFTELPDKKIIRMSFNVDNKLGSFIMYMDAKDFGLVTYGIIPLHGDKDTEAALLRYVAMANYGLIDGNFEYDVRDGEIRYKSWLPAYEELTDEAIDHSVGCVVAMIERYGNGFGKLVFGISDPKTEIDEAEHGSHSPDPDSDGDGEDDDASTHEDSDDISDLLRRLIEGLDIDDDDDDDDDDDEIEADIEDVDDDGDA